MRAVGLDLGERRIGVAVSDSAGVLASPYEVVDRGRDHSVDHAAVAALVSELGVDVVVVGLPISLDGSLGPAAQSALAEIEELTAVLDVPVATHDERLTSVTAHRVLADRGVRSRERRRVVDKVAAAVMLQAWLDGQHVRE